MISISIIWERSSVLAKLLLCASFFLSATESWGGHYVLNGVWYSEREYFDSATKTTKIGASVDGFVYGEERDSVYIPDTVHLTIYRDEKMTEIDTVYHYRVVHIKSFKDETRLEKIRLPKGLLSISASAFSGSGLVEIDIPESVTSINESTFSGCKRLKAATFGKGVTKISEWAFANSGLTSISIPDSVTEIGEHAFSNCKDLKSAKIGKGVTKIENYVFQGCESLEELPLMPSVTEIGDYAFRGCGIWDIKFSSDMEKIGYNAFAEYPRLRMLELGNGVKTMEASAFSGCKNLESVTIGTGLSEIPNSAFSDCTSLKLWAFSNITDHVKRIGANAFMGCRSLQKLRLPEVETIHTSAFSGCSSLESVELGNENLEIQRHAFKDCTSLRFFIFHGCHPKSKTSAYVYFNAESAFNGCSNITVRICPEVKVIYNWFNECDALSKVIIEEGNTKIGEWAFSSCTNLQEVEIPQSMNTIEYGAFRRCEMLKKIGTLESVTTYGTYVFSGCYALEEIRLSQDLRKIEAGMFYDCTSLKSISLPDALKDIANGAFSGCTSLEKIDFGNSAQLMIGGRAFSECISLKTLAIPDDVECEIGSYAFEYCTSLRNITLGNGVTSIGIQAFSGIAEQADARTRSDYNFLTVRCHTSSLPEASKDAFSESGVENSTLYVKKGMLTAYQTTTPWSGFGRILELPEDANVRGVKADFTGSTRICVG